MNYNDYLLMKSKSKFGMIANMLREAKSNGIHVDEVFKNELIGICHEMYKKLDACVPGYPDEYYEMEAKEFDKEEDDFRKKIRYMIDNGIKGIIET